MNESMHTRTKSKFSIGRAVLSLAVTLGIGSLGGFLARNGFERYKSLDMPPLSPPSWVFPVVWSILYVIMSVGIYLLLSRERDEKTKNALTIFAVYMVLNFLWPMVFFDKGAFFAALILAILQLILLISAIRAFFPLSETAALTLVPTALWTAFAIYLNAGIALMN